MFDNIDLNSLVNLLTDVALIFVLLVVLRRQRKHSARLAESIAKLRVAAGTPTPQARRVARNAAGRRARGTGLPAV